MCVFALVPGDSFALTLAAELTLALLQERREDGKIASVTCYVTRARESVYTFHKNIYFSLSFLLYKYLFFLRSSSFESLFTVCSSFDAQISVSQARVY